MRPPIATLIAPGGRIGKNAAASQPQFHCMPNFRPVLFVVGMMLIALAVAMLVPAMATQSDVQGLRFPFLVAAAAISWHVPAAGMCIVIALVLLLLWALRRLENEWARIAAHEQALVAHLDAGLREIDRVRVVGRPRERVGAVSFVVDGWRTEDVGEALDRHGVAVRAGHHCAQPALRHFGLATTIRPSVAAYNTHADVEACLAALRDVVRGEPPVT